MNRPQFSPTLRGHSRLTYGQSSELAYINGDLQLAGFTITRKILVSNLLLQTSRLNTINHRLNKYRLTLAPFFQQFPSPPPLQPRIRPARWSALRGASPVPEAGPPPPRGAAPKKRLHPGTQAPPALQRPVGQDGQVSTLSNTQHNDLWQ